MYYPQQDLRGSFGDIKVWIVRGGGGGYGILIFDCNIFNFIDMIQNMLFQMLKIKME